MKTILITGSTDGIGKQTALELARQGHHVLLHGRSPQRGAAALAEIRAGVPGAQLDYLNADLSSMEQVRRLAQEALALAPRLDVLLHNAGAAVKERTLTPDGLETSFAVNHLAPFLLSALLLERLKASAPARIVLVSSTAHSGGRIEFDNLQGEGSFDGWQAYCNTKLMSVLFIAELAARLEGSGVSANSLHPGLIATKMLAASFPDAQGASLEVGAQTPLFLATAAEAEGLNGLYFKRSKPAEPSPLAYDRELRQRLWEVSQELAGLKFLNVGG
jgi:NAD(P)-dependent dehydrogenase (short-subunit alcohol dehydrogenase family)